MFEELENKVVLITGAATGIGKSIAENFGKAKAKVVINYRSDRHHDEIEEIKQTVAKFGGQTLVVQGDVSIEEDIKRLKQQLITTIIIKCWENKKGTIINISSVHDTIPWPNYVHYAASKGGLKLMMETMSMEYAQYGIRINNISPGAIVTEHTEEKFSDPTTREETKNDTCT